MRSTLLLAAALFSILPNAFGCSIPVFRYALEAWTPASYELIVFHRGPLSDELREQLGAYKRAAEDAKSPVNISVTDVDVLEKMEEHIQQIWSAHKSENLPFAVVTFPESGDSVWSGPLSAAQPLALADSPARSEIAKRLACGDSAVYVFLESSDEKQNAAAAEMLQKELAALQATMKLPEQDEADERLPRRRQLDIPLRLSFSIVRVSRSDEKEKAFVNLLMRCDKKLSAAKPIVFPIFGRGRLLCAMTGNGLSAASLAESATFMTGACSCQVKELNPGVDLLMSVNWDELFDAAIKDYEKNPQKYEPREVNTPPPPIKKDVTPPVVAPAPALKIGEPANVDKNGSGRTLLWLATAAAAVLVVITGRWALNSRNNG